MQLSVKLSAFLRGCEKDSMPQIGDCPLVSNQRNISNTDMRTFRQRVWVAVFATACGLAAGGAGGYLGGRAITLQQSAARLELYATRIIDEGQKSFFESRKVLKAMNASHYQACSDAEIDYFSKLVFEAQYLKAAGRMHDGRIQCSTNLGRTAQSQVQYNPDILQHDGTRMYRNLAPYRVANQTVITIQLGEYYIVYSPYNLTPLLNSSMQMTVTDLDAPNRDKGHVLGTQIKDRPAFLVKNGQFHDSTLIYGTHCSADGIICVAAHVPIAHAMESNRLQIGGFVALGGLTGILLGFVCAVIYRRQQGFENQLLRAIRKDALNLVYQPIVDLATGEIVEVEALARWTNEENKPVSPDDFIK